MERKINFRLAALWLKSQTCLSLWLIFFGVCSLNANAQVTPRTITGVVTDAQTGQPIPGAGVVIKGTPRGTATDVNGRFTLTVNNSDVLTVSFVGYSPQDIPVAEQSELSIRLRTSVGQFDEVVVIGYGVQRKKLVTGATLQVDGESLQRRSTTNALQALQGQAPGVQITSTSGQPGSDLKVVVRGLGTIGNSGPLYVVDGIQTGDISYLNNADIETIDILKDAASAAIYGSQAANGVVLITTKTGTKGKPLVTFDAYYGVQNLARKVKLLNSKEYAVVMNEQAINAGKLPFFTSAEISEMGAGTDWIDEMFYNNATTQNYTLGFTGGGDASLYSLSLSYTGQEGIVGGPSVSNYDRYNFRINTEHKLFDNLITVGQHLTFSYIQNNGIDVGNQFNNTLRGAFQASPFLPMFDDDGNFLNNTPGAGVMHQGEVWVPWFEGENNPYASMVYNNQNDDDDQKLFADIYAEVNPIKGLKFKTTFAIDYSVSEERYYIPAYQLSIYSFSLRDYARQYMSKGLAWTWDNVASYDFNIKDHSITAMLGMSAYQYKGSFVSVRNSNLTIPDLGHAWIDNTTNTDLTNLTYNGGPLDESLLVSYFARASYNYKEKYLANATMRMDGTSRFSKDQRWGYFPSISLGWVASSEPFIEPVSDWLDFLKVRASWGRVGNQNIDAWQYLATITTANTNYYFGSVDFNASGNTVGAFPNRLANPDLKWETSEQLNLGFDARFLNSRLTATFDWYKKTTKDWLLEAPILATAGADAPFINGGTVKNKGAELAVAWADNIGELKYSVNANITINKNKVTEVPTEDGIVHGLTNMLYDNSTEFYRRAESGFPIGYFWGWQTNGVFQNPDEVLAYKNSQGTVIQPSASPGDLKYIDQNDDGSIGSADKVKVGDPNPDYIFGFSLGLDYKDWDFYLAANGVAGNQLVQSYRNHPNAYANYTTEILGRWHGEGTSNRIPRVTETNINYLFSDIFVKDGDFLRVGNITVGYDFTRLAKQSYLSRLRLYASVLNAFTFTKYNGMDPEIGYGVENGSSGVDLGYYPRPRTFMIGVNVKF